MDIKGIKIDSLKESPVDTDILLSRLSSGKAILFTGAGFSRGTENIFGEEPPFARQLATKIGESIIQMPDLDDLMLASDIALRHGSRKELLNLLKDCFSLKGVSDDHKEICSINWKRCYTTNYDNSINLAYNAAGKRIECIDVSAKIADFIHEKNLCIHINGKIQGATLEDLDERIKLTNSSYLSADSFLTTSWNTILKRDLESSSAIVFLGYSLYDIDVQRILFQTPELIEKTYFITGETIEFKDKYILSKFGQVMPIGLRGLSKLVSENKNKFVATDSSKITSLSRRITNDEILKITDTEASNFLIFGNYNRKMLDYCISTNYKKSLLVNRSIISEIIQSVISNKNILIHGELGNGKTILLEIISYILTSSGIESYFLNEKDGDYLNDFEILAKSSKRSVVIIDGCSEVFDIIQNAAEYKCNNVTFVISERSSRALNLYSKFHDLEFNISEFSVDSLHDSDIDGFISLIERLGLWKEYSSLSQDLKRERISHKYGGQISGILLGLLDSPQIKDKIKELVDGIIFKSTYKDTLFAIALCDILDVEATSSTISDLAGNNEIYENSFRTNESFKNLYNFDTRTNRIVTKSSLMSLSIVNHIFSERYVCDRLLDTTESLNAKYKGVESYKEILKSLVKFSVIERFLPRKQDALNRYYMEVKDRCTWLIKHPHYWVQYAMCRLSFKDYPAAQIYLTDAYSYAKDFGKEYHTQNIDTQQARLFILQALDSHDKKESFELFNKAHKLLFSLPDDGFKYRQVHPYREIYSNIYNAWNQKDKVYFEHACKNLITQIDESVNDPRNLSTHKRVMFQSSARDILQNIIDDIAKNRKPARKK